MSSGRQHDLIADYESQMKKFLEDPTSCGQAMELDQQVPYIRSDDTQFLKTEIKTEMECLDQQPQLINFYGMEDALVVNQTSVTEGNLPTTLWQTPFCSTTTNNTTGSYSNTDCKDSLDTPTPFCSNSLHGLTWGPSLTSLGNSQSPFLSSTSSSPLSSTVASPAQTASSQPSSSSSLLSSSQSSTSSSSQQSERFFNAVSSSEMSLSSTSTSSSSSSLSSPFTVSLPDSKFDLQQQLPFSRNSVPLIPPSSLSSSTTSLNEFGFSPPVPATTTKVRTNITNELVGSGCTLVSSSVNFLSEAPHQALSEDALEYTDLDKQPFSMYEDDFNMGGKQHMNDNITASATAYDPDLVSLNFTMMHDTLRKDCEDLNIPFDPMSWSPEHVRCWMSAICSKNEVPDISSQLYPIDGPSLCTMPESTFQYFGEAGKAIGFELACCKAANSYVPQEQVPAMELPQQQTFVTSSCVSPAPSSGSNSHTSNGFSTPSDQSEDEAYFSSASSTEKPKARPSSGGRSIYLWQFLVELLLSTDPAHADCIRWMDREKGIFKIEDSKKVAFLWGKRKNRPLMNYDKLSRSVRQYYKKGIIKKTQQSRRLVYQFCDSTLATIM